MATEEKVEGCVVDMHCLRVWPYQEYAQRAKDHTITCSLQHVEDGYALVEKNAVLLDKKATPMVLRALHESDQERGIKLRVLRRAKDKMMETVIVDLAIPREKVSSSNLLSVGYHDRTLEIEFKN